jgi:hypothetical protein
MKNELSQNINIRMNLQTKKKIMEEAHHHEMNMSEYILFLLEDYWESNHENELKAESQQLKELVSVSQAEINEANAEINRLKTLLTTTHDNFNVEKNGIWDEAKATAQKLAKRHVEQERIIAVREFKENHLNKLVSNDREVVKQLRNRLVSYETNQLRELFEAVRHNETVRDLPDVVNALVGQYFKQLKEINEHD